MLKFWSYFKIKNIIFLLFSYWNSSNICGIYYFIIKSFITQWLIYSFSLLEFGIGTKFNTRGFSLKYDHTYDWVTTYAQLQEIYEQCTEQSILCVQVLKRNTKIAAACGNCHRTLTNTTLNMPVQSGLAWWYLTDGNLTKQKKLN